MRFVAVLSLFVVAATALPTSTSIAPAAATPSSLIKSTPETSSLKTAVNETFSDKTNLAKKAAVAGLFGAAGFVATRLGHEWLDASKQKSQDNTNVKPKTANLAKL